MWENSFTLVSIQKGIVVGKSGLVSACQLADHLITSKAWKIPAAVVIAADAHLHTKNWPRRLALFSQLLKVPYGVESDRESCQARRRTSLQGMPGEDQKWPLEPLPMSSWRLSFSALAHLLARLFLGYFRRPEFLLTIRVPFHVCRARLKNKPPEACLRQTHNNHV